MGLLALTNGMTYDAAVHIAERYDIGFVCKSFDPRSSRVWMPKPIVMRQRIKNLWYNYFDDGTYEKSTCHSKGDVEVYTPALYVPDQIRYIELLKYIQKHLVNLVGLYETYLLYRSMNNQSFIYSIYEGDMTAPVSMAFDNALLHFVSGRPTMKHPHR